jgi:hypothetical protein
MSDEQQQKQEWVFDVSRGEFWITVILLVYALVWLALGARSLFWGYHPPAHTSWIDWFVLAILPLYAIGFYRIEKSLGITVWVLFLNTVLRLATTHTTDSTGAIHRVLPFLDPLIWGFTLVGCGLYLKRNLRRESIQDGTSGVSQ